MSYLSLYQISNSNPHIYQMQPIADEPEADIFVASNDNGNNNKVLNDLTLDEKPSLNYAKNDLNCLTSAVYHEARGESTKGAVAVAEVILNRAKSGKFPSKVCGVVYDRNRNMCQFSFVCNGDISRPKNQVAWSRSKEIAKSVLEGKTTSVSGGALFFHAAHVKPSWASKMRRTAQIGAHTFYKPY